MASIIIHKQMIAKIAKHSIRWLNFFKPQLWWKCFSSLTPDEKPGARKDVLRSGTYQENTSKNNVFQQETNAW